MKIWLLVGQLSLWKSFEVHSALYHFQPKSLLGKFLKKRVNMPFKRPKTIYTTASIKFWFKTITFSKTFVFSNSFKTFHLYENALKARHSLSSLDYFESQALFMLMIRNQRTIQLKVFILVKFFQLLFLCVVFCLFLRIWVFGQAMRERKYTIPGAYYPK